jgi:phthalate 4,5-cis-dihydrodiol dehydrogenase
VCAHENLSKDAPVTDRKLRLGIAGLGRGFSVMLPTLALHPGLDVAAAADTRPEALARFEADFGGTGYLSVDDMCADPALDAIYVATPHQFHADNTVAAARAGKHVLVEKPMALTLAECTAMIEAAAEAGVHLLVGHSHSFDAPIAEARRLIAAGDYGAPQMITAMNYTDFVYRPRRPEELDTDKGGGVAFSQAAHQIDIVRLLAGGMAESVYATNGRWDPERPTDGAYSAILKFAGGATASMVYSGYGRFDSDEFCGWIAESGKPKDPAAYGAARKALEEIHDPAQEAAVKAARAYGGTAGQPLPTRDDVAGRKHEQFGLFVVSCERADLRPMPDGVMVYGETEKAFRPLPDPIVPRTEVIDELYDAVFGGVSPVHTGEWGRATLEVCLALVESGRTGKEVALKYQVPVGDAGAAA